MKPICNQTVDDLENEIKRQFEKFNRFSSPSKGRKYPKPLKDLVSRGVAQGIEPKTLRQLTGMTSSTINYCAKNSPNEPPRRLEVIETAILTPQVMQPNDSVFVHLPSGVTIELANGSALNHGLLSTLATLEVRNVASR